MLGRNVVLLMRSSISCLACSFFWLCSNITSRFPEVDEIYFFCVSDREKIFELFFQSRIRSVFIDGVDRYNGGVMDELVLLNYLVFDSI